MKFDDIVIQLGEFGRYQIRAYFLICLVGIPCAFHGLVPVFLAGQSDHWCVVPELSNEDCSKWPGVTPQACEDAKKDASIPLQTKTNMPYEYDNCLRYNLTGVPFYPGVNTPEFTNDTLSCDYGWVYDTTQFETTIVSEFDLVCTKSSLPDLSQSLYFVGILLGSLIFPSLSDIIGRYYTYFITAGVFLVSGIATAFSPSILAFNIFRMVVGAANVGAFVTAFVLATEFVGPSKRTIAAMGVNYTFSIGYMLLALLAFFIRDWVTLQLVISVPIVLLFLLIPLISESPRWLMSKGRFDEAEKIIHEVARVNKATLPKQLFEEHEKEKALAAAKEHQATAIDLFRTPALRRRTLNLMFNWTVNTLVYYGLSLSTSDLGSDPYVAFFLSGLVEVPAYIWITFGIEWFGRKYNLSGLLLLGGVACLVTIVTPAGTAKTTVAMLGKFCISATFALIYIYTAELSPTGVRAASVGICSMAARIGGILAPLILVIGDLWEPLPYILFGSLAIIAGFLSLLFPETKGRTLPETLEEGENFGKLPKDDIEKTTTNGALPTDDGIKNPAYTPDTDINGFEK